MTLIEREILSTRKDYLNTLTHYRKILDAGDPMEVSRMVNLMHHLSRVLRTLGYDGDCGASIEEEL
jgi:hypothetical protein